MQPSFKKNRTFVCYILNYTNIYSVCQLYKITIDRYRKIL